MDFTPHERAVYGLQRGDVVLTEASGSAAHVGRAALWEQQIPECCFQNTVIRFRPHAVAPRFALMWFEYNSVSGIFGRLARGVGILHLGAIRLSSLSIAVPPFSEQERIAAEVDRRRTELRKAETALRSAQERIAEQRREILRLAVGGQLLSGAEDSKSESSAHVAGAPSNGWRWVRVDEAGYVDLGKKREPTSHHGPNMRPYLRVANVHEDYIDTTDVKEMNFSPDEFDKLSLQIGDVLLNEGQSPELVGRPAMYRGDPSDACFQMTLLRFRANLDVLPEFALIVFRHYLHAGEFRRVAQGSTNIVHLSRKRLSAMQFPVPPLPEQHQIVAEFKTRMESLRVQEELIASSLARIPDMLKEVLTAAVRGKLLPQSPDDEPAANLLDRLGEPPKAAVPPAEQSTQTETQSAEEKVDTRATESEGQSASSAIVGALEDAEGPMPLSELFTKAGYSRDSIADVETFYLGVREAYGSAVTAADDRPENTALRMIDDAPQ
uniref:restriction endonuclease subunit S n=1 Tax=Paractinoplanes polyasparticus TaxID=2856853 RepID=UPI00210253D9|nr:restriction endonuclease subunit S [Actinoplanes polyasparticus]